MKIYFAASIRGGRDDRDLYAKIIELLREYGTVLTEHIGNKNLLQQGEIDISDETIFKRDAELLEECGAIVAEVTAPSLGVGYELGRMDGKKPVLCLFREENGKRLSAMLAGNGRFKIRRYQEAAEIKAILEEFFKTIKCGKTDNAENDRHKEYIDQAAETAARSTCLRARCGSVIVKNGEIIGTGSNSPAGNLERQRKCSSDKNSLHKKVTDKTCCVHAEQRAIMDALRKNPDKLGGSSLYFVRLDKNGKIEKAGRPYCTICSKMALDAGIKEFILWHEEGIRAYSTEEYNLLSYDYRE